MSQSDLCIRTILPDDHEQVWQLHRAHYWRSHCLLLNPEFYHWQFALPPESAAAGGDQSVVVVDCGGRLLSYVAAYPVRLRHRGAAMRGLHFMSWLFYPAARGHGVGNQLLAWLTGRHDFIYLRDATPGAALAAYRRSGMRSIPRCQRWLVVLDAAGALALAVDGDEAADRRARARAVDAREAGYEVSPLPPPGAAELIGRCLADETYFERSQAYLTWRYAQHPFQRYQFIQIGPAEAPDGVAVVRLEEVQGRRGRVLRIIELVAPRGQAVRLARAVVAYGQASGCAYADFFGLSERFAAGLVGAGGFHADEEPELRLPHLLRPWDDRVAPPGLLVYGRRIGDEPGPADDLASLYVCKGDGNMDWPSWLPDENGRSIAPPVGRPAPAEEP